MKSAGTPLDDRDFLGFVTTAATHQIATVDPDTGVVALSTLSAEDPKFRIPFAKRWRRVEIDQIHFTGWLVFRIVRFQLEIITVSTAQALAMTVHRITRRITNYRIPIAASG